MRSDRWRRFEVLIAPENEGQVIEGIVKRLCEGKTFREICAELDQPEARLLMWLQSDEERWEAYRKASEALGMQEADEARQILDDMADGEAKELTGPMVALAKERSAVRRWRAGKLARELYGDREVSINNTIAVERMSERDLMQSIGAILAEHPDFVKELALLQPQVAEKLVGSGKAVEESAPE